MANQYRAMFSLGGLRVMVEASSEAPLCDVTMRGELLYGQRSKDLQGSWHWQRLQSCDCFEPILRANEVPQDFIMSSGHWATLLVTFPHKSLAAFF